jgi:hypothetical protein
MTRTAEQQSALSYIQSAIKPHADDLLDQFAEMLADVPAHDLDREINNLGHILMLTLRGTAPDLSEATHYGLPFAFAEMLRERITRRAPAPNGTSSLRNISP